MISWSLNFRSPINRYRGIIIRISCPKSLTAFGRALETSASPPVFANGSASLVTKRILRGLDISPNCHNFTYNLQFTQILPQLQNNSWIIRKHVKFFNYSLRIKCHKIRHSDLGSLTIFNPFVILVIIHKLLLYSWRVYRRLDKGLFLKCCRRIFRNYVYRGNLFQVRLIRS